jgi:predicted DNA-binding transcriptional regulator YafY
MAINRFVADRFRRIWHIAQDIADHPGQSRRDLADKFHLSERQVQADLNIIRCDMRLPLVRRSGYRFMDEAPPANDGALTLQEAQLLASIISRARGDRVIPSGRLDSLVAKLPSLFPPHIAPLAAQTLRAALAGRRGARDGFTTLMAAILRGEWVKLHYTVSGPNGEQWLEREPVIRPEILIPYLGDWYVIGEIHGRAQQVMFALDHVTSVSAVSKTTADVEGMREVAG